MPKAELGLVPSIRKMVPTLLLGKASKTAAVPFARIVVAVAQSAVVQFKTVTLLLESPVRVRVAPVKDDPGTELEDYVFAIPDGVADCAGAASR
jgi:hypothetical protein